MADPDGFGKPSYGILASIAASGVIAIVASVAIILVRRGSPDPAVGSDRRPRDAAVTNDAGGPAFAGRAGSGDPRTAQGDLHTSAGAPNAAQVDTLTPDTDALFVECDFDPVLYWNVAEDQVRQLTQQGDELKSRINRLWDDMPATAQGETQLNSPDANSPLAEESYP